MFLVILNIIIHFISNKKLLIGILPTIITIDEFKATKDTKWKMAFYIINNKTGKTFDIIESKKLIFLLFKKVFPNAILITDKIHVVALPSNVLKNTRVKRMNKDEKNYNKLKHYWKLIQKFEADLDKENKKIFYALR